MADLTPDELAALGHWSSFGAPGTPPADRFVPDADELARVQPILDGESAAWSDELDAGQAAALLKGYPRGEMEDKWVVFADEPSPSGTAAVHFIRSWTGAEIIRIDLQLTSDGARITRATWETSRDRVKNSDEAFARTTFVEACRWVLRMDVTGWS